jgi:hypothetical protein
MSVRRGIAIGGVIAGLALVAVLGTATLIDRAGGGRVYSLAQVEDGLLKNPKAWLGRTVRVRAVISVLAAPCSLIVGGCGRAPASYYALEAPPAASTQDPSSLIQPLPLTVGTADSVSQTLQRIPLLRNLVPGPPRLLEPGVVRVRLAPTQAPVCALILCYQALLLGPPPDGSAEHASMSRHPLRN